MGEERVGDPAEARPGLGVVERDRLVAQVSARHHERAVHICAEQVVERRVGEHHTEPRRPRRDGGRNRRARAGPDEDDWPLTGAEPLLVGGRQLRDELRRRCHQRERLLLALLPCPQARDRLLGGGVAGEVVAAEALDGEDPALAEDGDRLLERHRELRPADGAGDWLGVEAPVERVLVLAAAVGAEREAGHRRVRPVVGDGADDREPGPALRAVDERVAMAAVGRVEQLPQAVVAGGDVGRNQRRAARRRARLDRERGLATARHGLRGD